MGRTPEYITMIIPVLAGHIFALSDDIHVRTSRQINDVVR